MLQFIRTVKDKYRIYILTRITSTNDEEVKGGDGETQSEVPGYDQKEYAQIREVLERLVKQEVIKGKQRLMYSHSEIGHVAQIRQLAADLHIESK